MFRQLEKIPYIKDLVKSLRWKPYLGRVCGYGDRAPCKAHFSQMKSRIGDEGFRVIEAWLRREASRLRRAQPLSTVDLVQAVGLDGTSLPLWSSRAPHDTHRGLGAPDARLGRGKSGFILGYQSLFLVDIEGFPLGIAEAPLNVNEKELVEELLARVLRTQLLNRLSHVHPRFSHRFRLHIPVSLGHRG